MQLACHYRTIQVSLCMSEVALCLGGTGQIPIRAGCEPWAHYRAAPAQVPPVGGRRTLKVNQPKSQLVSMPPAATEIRLMFEIRASSIVTLLSSPQAVHHAAYVALSELDLGSGRYGLSSRDS